MTYGLYDADLPYYPTPFFNLELMKLSSYYKRKREIVGLSPDFSPQRYGHFIIRQDFHSPNPLILKAMNIEYGGRAFDGINYKSLPLEIETMRPDISLYDGIKLPKRKISPHIISTMRRAEHVRLSLDGKTIWNQWERQLRKESGVYGIIFHDYNLNDIESAVAFIKSNLTDWIKSSNGRRVGMKFPVQVDNQNDLYEWLQIMPMGSYYSLHHIGLLNESYASDLVEINKEFHTLLQVSIDISNQFTYKELINGGLQRIFRNIVNLRTYGLVFPLIYDEALFIDSNWRDVMRLIHRYSDHLVRIRSTDFFKRVEPHETLYSFCKGAIKEVRIKEPLLSKESIETIFQFVRENDYDLFKDFYEYRGGEVRSDR